MLRPDRYGNAQEPSRWAPEPLGGVFADANYCGRSFNNGLIRFHNATSGPEALTLVREGWGDDLPAGTVFFAFDWLGRQFGVTEIDGTPTVIAADIGLGVLEEVAALKDFIGVLNGPRFDGLFESARYEAWLSVDGGTPLEFEQCLGYKHPLFLGGSEALENLERSTIEVYWTVIGRVFARTRDLPEGAVVTEI